ncbi:MAG: ABC transporter ATP-binding protein [Cytophaga sp.]|nr:ABC transporter ATP-binding protein [Undibacterium sp.]
MSTTQSTLIILKNLSKQYRNKAGNFTALSNASFTVSQGEFLAIVGKSGSGKSTLLNLISGIDSPTSGEIRIAGTAIHSMSEEALVKWRGKSLGVVFQFFQLLPTLSIIENVMLPMDFCHTYPPSERRARALALLKKLDIAEQADKLPADLSGGQQQRAAIARALANDPAVIVADEPTGNLDSHTSNDVMQLFAQLVREGKTVVMVTHERDLRHYFTRTITLVDGVVQQDLKDLTAVNASVGELNYA